jgi:hypothetical protein
MGCGCKDSNEVQESVPVDAPAIFTSNEPVFEESFSSKLDSIQSEKQIWKESYEQLSKDYELLVSKIDSVIDTLPEDVQQKFASAFKEEPETFLEGTGDLKEDILVKFKVEMDLGTFVKDYDVCDIMDGIRINFDFDSEVATQYEVRFGDVEIESADWTKHRDFLRSLPRDTDPELF